MAVPEIEPLFSPQYTIFTFFALKNSDTGMKNALQYFAFDRCENNSYVTRQ